MHVGADAAVAMLPFDPSVVLARRIRRNDPPHADRTSGSRNDRLRRTALERRTGRNARIEPVARLGCADPNRLCVDSENRIGRVERLAGHQVVRAAVVEERPADRVMETDVRVLNMPLLNTANKANGLLGKFVADLVLYLLSFVAESERVNIKERQRQGIDAAMKRGVKFGRPQIGDDVEIAKNMTRIKSGELSVESAAKICRVSPTTIRRRMKQKVSKI